MSFDLSHDLPEDMHEILKSAVNIVNDDFDYFKFMRAFSQNDSWASNTYSMPTLSPQVSTRKTSMETDSLKSCPPMRQPVFTFDEVATLKESRFSRGSSQILDNEPSGRGIRRASTETFGQNSREPVLKLQITGNPNYELDESDILSIFSRYGNVQRIDLAKFRTAFIVFDNTMNAVAAQKILNGQYMKHLDIKLYLSWANTTDEDTLKSGESQPQTISTPSNGIFRNEYSNVSGNTPKTLPPNIGSTNSLPSFPYNSAKYTCKYEIQIDNDKDFKIARKIIGPKGCNMKKIIEICQFHLKRSDIIFQSDFLKLRLRGRGSGFKEGPEQRESSDPLHLCVSSKYSEVYHLACKLVEDLLNGLYKEYEGFCHRAGRPLSEPVQIKRIEIYNGSNEKKSVEDTKTPNSKSRSNSNEFNQPLSRPFGNSESPNNSLSGISDPELNTSPSKQTEICVQLDEPDYKSP